jgi:hypothetical protein
MNMKLHLRRGIAGIAAALMLAGVLSLSAQSPNRSNDQSKDQGKATEYTIKVMPPGGPAPRLSDGHPDFSGLWLPNGAGQGVSGRYGVDPLRSSSSRSHL